MDRSSLYFLSSKIFLLSFITFWKVWRLYINIDGMCAKAFRKWLIGINWAEWIALYDHLSLFCCCFIRITVFQSPQCVSPFIVPWITPSLLLFLFLSKLLLDMLPWLCFSFTFLPYHLHWPIHSRQFFLAFLPLLLPF